MAERRPPRFSGILLVDKPQGLSSHDVVSRVRRIFGQREVGHTGTLDPMATGLLVLTLGRATRVGRFIEAESKRYEGTVQLGASTDTLDAMGRVLSEAAVPVLDRIAIEGCARALTGTIEQTVPAFSAVKVDGQRLHRMARRGEEVELPKRTVEIRSLILRALSEGALELEAEVSKGTYIRSLAVQIAETLGTLGHLSRLVRTAVGTHSLADAHALESLEGRAEELISIREALAGMPELSLDARAADDVAHGRPLRAGQIRPLEAVLAPEMPFLLVSPEGDVAAVGSSLFEAEALAALPDSERAMRYACVLSTG